MNSFGTLLVYAINGLLWGLIIALIALGLSLVFGLTRILNLAHGEFFMLGAVLSWYFIEPFHLNFWLAALMSAFAVGMFGILVGQGLLRVVRDDWNNSLIVTFALALILQYAVLAKFGGAPRRISAPIQSTFSLLGWNYPAYRLALALISSIVLVATWLFLHRTRWGRWIRAVHQNREVAITLGIPVQKVYWITFGLGSGLAALGGVLVAPIIAVQFRMGSEILVLSFMAVILGGLGNISGTVAASILIGELENLPVIFMDPLWTRVLTLTVIACILLVRPEGLFVLGKE